METHDDELTSFADLLDSADADAPAPDVDPVERARRRRRRLRAGITTAIVALVIMGLAGGYAAYALTTPVALPAAETRTPQPAAGAPASLAMPAGASAVQVSGGTDFLGADGLAAASGAPGPLPMASITKLVTALVVLDAHPLSGPDDPGPVLTFSKADHDLYDQYYVRGATIAAMPTGSTMSLHDALELMLVVSASNYADAVSTWAFGSRGAFLRATDAWLERNGLAGITVVEPTGLDPRNTATAADLITLGTIAMSNETIAGIVGMTTLDVPGFTGSNTNSLLGTDGVRGIKTGTLEGSNLLFSSLLDVGIDEPLTITGAVLGGADRDSVNSDVERMLGSIRSGFHAVSLARRGDVYGSYETPWGAEAQMVVAADAAVLTWSDTPITAEMTTSPLTTGRAGEKVGTITWTAGPRTLSTDLVLDADIAMPDDWWRLTHPLELDGPLAGRG